MRTSDGSGFPQRLHGVGISDYQTEFQEKRDDNHVNIQIAAPHPPVGVPRHHQEIALFHGPWRGTSDIWAACSTGPISPRREPAA